MRRCQGRPVGINNDLSCALAQCGKLAFWCHDGRAFDHLNAHHSDSMTLPGPNLLLDSTARTLSLHSRTV